MRLPSGRLVTYLAIVVLLLGLVSTGVGFILRRHRQMNSQVVPFTMVSTQQFFKAGENKRPPRANITRFQRSDGNWKEVVTYYNEDRSIRGTTTTLGITGRGVFKVNDDVQKLFFLSPMYHA